MAQRPMQLAWTVPCIVQCVACGLLTWNLWQSIRWAGSTAGVLGAWVHGTWSRHVGSVISVRTPSGQCTCVAQSGWPAVELTLPA
eukprot:4503064-Lingulodinium_polyedra.AAC.1